MLGFTIQELNQALKTKRVTVADVLKKCEKTAGEIKDLNAFVKLTTGDLTHAKISDQHFAKGTPRSVLEGIPIAVKDNFCIKDITTTCGSNMLRNFQPKYTATVISKLLSAGAILVGKTNLDEFAMGSGTIDSIHGPTKNCWGFKSKLKKNDDWFIAGGSSGGSAVAVASGACLAAIGSDTGGSTRNPASYCGVVGLKPTYGLLSRHGLIPLVNSMDVPGILTKKVEDASILLNIMAGHDVNDSTTVKRQKIEIKLNAQPSVKGLKIGIPMEYHCEGLSEEVKEVWKNIAGVLEKGGATVKSMSMPHTKYSVVCYSVLNQCEVASNMARYDGVEFGYRSSNNNSTNEMYAETRSQGFNLVVRRRILAGNYFLLASNYEKYFVKALKVRRLIAQDFQNAWREGYNALLVPTTLTDSPLYSEFIKKDEREQCATEDYCTQPANMSGCPAISIPIAISKKGLPLSLQLMSPNFDEQVMLQIAHFIENEVQFSKHRCSSENDSKKNRLLYNE